MIILEDTTVALPFDVFTSAVRQAEEQARLEALQKAGSSSSKDLRRAKAGYKRARGAVLKADVEVVRPPIPDPLPAAERLSADAKEQAEVARVAATEARTAFEGAKGASVEAQLVSATQAEKVKAAARHHEASTAARDKAAAKVAHENLEHLLRTEMGLAQRLGFAAAGRENLVKELHCNLAVDPNVHEFLDRSVHAPAFLELLEGSLDELTPTDVAAVRAEGKAVADAMWAATASAVAKGKAEMDPGVRVYVPSLLEAKSLAVREEMVVRTTVKLKALRFRRCARERVSEAFSLAAQEARLELGDATAGLASTTDSCANATYCAAAAAIDLRHAETMESQADVHREWAAANVRSLQQQQQQKKKVDVAATEQEVFEDDVRQVEAILVEARSARRRAGLDFVNNCNELRDSMRRGEDHEEGWGGG